MKNEKGPPPQVKKLHGGVVRGRKERRKKRHEKWVGHWRETIELDMYVTHLNVYVRATWWYYNLGADRICNHG